MNELEIEALKTKIEQDMSNATEFENVCNSFNEELKGCYDEEQTNKYDLMNGSNTCKLQHKVLSMFLPEEENNRFLLSKDMLELIDSMQWGAINENTNKQLIAIINNFKENKDKLHHAGNPYSRKTKAIVSSAMQDTLVNRALNNPKIKAIDSLEYYNGRPEKGLDVLVTRALRNPKIKAIE
jgi:hypothetical protein